MKDHLVDPLVSILFPVNCIGCNSIVESRTLGAACRSCWESGKLYDGSGTFCTKCGDFLNEDHTDRIVHCGQCTELRFDLARAAGAYEGGLAPTVINLKRFPVLPHRAARMLHRVAENLEIEPSALVIPVPLSKQRMIERGFNQAAVIGHAIARHLGLQLDQHSLERIRHTAAHRAGMDKKARVATVEKAFRVVRPKLIAKRSIILVDDVLTSGSTASECAFELKNKGASRVNVLTLARAAFR
ncbi:MAG TPA: double zinc ribbon domain-containing protein [Pyrinomonadaceae bacterium]|nr:double zinc ribbon domain-containing protein [Pyrinomonadaceae bacterium]